VRPAHEGIFQAARPPNFSPPACCRHELRMGACVMFSMPPARTIFASPSNKRCAACGNGLDAGTAQAIHGHGRRFHLSVRPSALRGARPVKSISAGLHDVCRKLRDRFFPRDRRPSGESLPSRRARQDQIAGKHWRTSPVITRHGACVLPAIITTSVGNIIFLSYFAARAWGLSSATTVSPPRFARFFDAGFRRD